jgi:hypothetical protein
MVWIPPWTGGDYGGPDLSPDAGGSAFQPSANWAHGGPIIEREGISVVYHTQDEDEPAEIGWRAAYEIYALGVQSSGSVNGNFMEGPTALIAAMRAYVASKFGDTIDDSCAKSLDIWKSQQ